MPPRLSRLFSTSRRPQHAGDLSLTSKALITAQVYLAVHLFSTYVGEVSLTAGASMLPTLNTAGDAVYISKWYRRGRGVKRGDLITVKHPLMPGERASKRIVGMPGDYVLRGTPPIAGAEAAAVTGMEMMVQVPEGHVWVSGDNQPWSRDSRDYGPIPMALIRGKLLARIFPLSQAQWLGNTFEKVGGS